MPGVTFNVLQQITIELHYGPYEAHGVIQHKQQRLYGVKNRLEELDFEVKLIPTQMFNTLIVKMKDRQIFRCDIRNLLFNMDCENDPVGKRLEMAVEDAKNRMLSDLTSLPKNLSGSVLQLIRMDDAGPSAVVDRASLDFGIGGRHHIHGASESMKNLAAAHVKLSAVEVCRQEEDAEDGRRGAASDHDNKTEEIVVKRASSMKNFSGTSSKELALVSDTTVDKGSSLKPSGSSQLKRFTATASDASDDKLTIGKKSSEEIRKSKSNASSYSSLLKKSSGTVVKISSGDNISNKLDVASNKSEEELDMDRKYVVSALRNLSENKLLFNRGSSSDTRITSDPVE